MPGPVNPARRRERLTSINDNKALSSAFQTNRNTPPPPKPRAPVRKCCDDPLVSTEDGSQICYNCGAVLEESDIVAEITFAENSAGGAVVQGGFVGDNQRHANSMGGLMRGMGGMGSREQTERNGREAITLLTNSLGLADRIKEQAISCYKLALNHNFVQGRRIRNVAAVAIYLAARRQPGNTLLLMDLSEKVQVNVWGLGDTYRKFLKTIMQDDPAQLANSTAVQEIEPLMLKFCRKLEFDEASHRVADDAVRLLKRMKRDWMVQGRNPAGLCGACIILAARMNNFRRTVREVVYVVKVADTTINQRLYEYRRTPTSALTVDQFREYGSRLKSNMQPPAIYRRAEKEERAEGRARKRKERQDDSVGRQIDDEEDFRNPSHAGPSKRTSRQRTDSGKPAATPNEGEAAPNAVVPEGGATEAELDVLAGAGAGDLTAMDAEEVVIPKKRGRSRKQREPIVIADEDLEIEAEIEQEITDLINWEPIFKEFEDNDNHEVLLRAGDRARQLAEQHMPDANINTNVDIGDDEFEDDPDVATCILSPAEVRNKERIWITMNEEWLREQQQKMLAKALEEAQGKPKKPKQTRRSHRMGDGSVLGGQPAASAAEAVDKMLKKNAKNFSSHVDYEKLRELFPDNNSTTSATPDGTGVAASPAASTSGQKPAQAAPIDQVEHAEGEEPDAEEEEEHYPEEEEFDDPNQYMDDEDEGFDPDESYEF